MHLDSIGGLWCGHHATSHREDCFMWHVPQHGAYMRVLDDNLGDARTITEQQETDGLHLPLVMQPALK
jgi:hypothetical protein